MCAKLTKEFYEKLHELEKDELWYLHISSEDKRVQDIRKLLNDSNNDKLLRDMERVSAYKAKKVTLREIADFMNISLSNVKKINKELMIIYTVNIDNKETTTYKNQTELANKFKTNSANIRYRLNKFILTERHLCFTNLFWKKNRSVINEKIERIFGDNVHHQERLQYDGVLD